MTEIACDVCILGGGITGLTVAHKLIEGGLDDLMVVEKEKRVGGLLNYHEFNGIKVDYGPHRLHIKDKEIEEYVLSLLDANYIASEKKSRIHLSNNFQIKYPPSISVALNLAIRNPIRSLSSIIHVLFNRSEERNLEEWLIKRFGKFYYDVIFKEYNKKMWGLPPSSLSPRLGGKRIENISILDLILRVFKKSDKHKALISSFLYPSTSIYQLCSSLENRYLGNRIRKNETVTMISKSDTGLFEVATVRNDAVVRKVVCKRIVSTIPLNSLKKLLENSESIEIESQCLRYRSLIIVYFYVNKESVIDDHWVYFPGREVFHRVFEQKNFNSKGFGGRTVIGAEIVCTFGDSAWNLDDKGLISRVSDELCECGLICKRDIINTSVLWLKDSYPIYTNGYEECRSVALRSLNDFGIYSCGRLGGFEYNSIEDSIASAFEMANILLAEK